MNECRRRTIIVDEIGDADAKESRVEPGIEASNAFALDNTSGGIKRRRLRTLRLDLCAGREGDERIAGGELSLVSFSIPVDGPSNGDGGREVKAGKEAEQERDIRQCHGQ